MDIELDPRPSNNTQEMDPGEISEPANAGKSKLGNCEVCAVRPAKYTCPKCEVKTCCLRCSVIHKRELECDGARDRTKFIPLNKFTNLDMSSDYRLMEEITRNIETYRKDRTRKFVRRDMSLPNFLFKLKNAARRRNTVLKFLPPNFARHKQNSTRLNFAKDVVFWHIDFVFPYADDLRLSEEKVRETEKLGSVLQKYFVKQENEDLQDKLLCYQALGLSGVKVFLCAEEKPGVKYYELDLCASLRDNLANRVIIEYPTIHVIKKDHASCYNVIDSDDEGGGGGRMDIDSKTPSGKQVIDKIVRKAENEDDIYKSMKNLLFISENADSDNSDDD